MIEINNVLDTEKLLDGIEAVIFDLDDTLYSEKDYVRSGYQVIAQSFPEIPAMFDELWSAFERKEPALDVVFEQHNIMQYKERALNLYRFHQPKILLYSGVEEMLERLHKTIKIGIITDGRPEGQRAKLEALNLYPIVDDIVITDELGGVIYRKPCEVAFQLMASHLQVPMCKICYVGDNLAKDFIAPQKLGMKWIWFKNTDGLYENRQDSN